MSERTYYQRLVEADWLYTANGRVLHHADLSVAEATELVDFGSLAGPHRLTCRRIARSLHIPGVLSRLSVNRCAGCCKRLDYPLGKGSPKNDPAVPKDRWRVTQPDTTTATHQPATEDA